MRTSRRDHMDKNDVVDRISNLPDDVLTHILSFVSTKEAVQTYALSKRWRDVWASVPILDFDDHKFWADGISDEEFMKQESKFIAFVSSVLENQADLTLDSFKLKWWGRYSCTYPCLCGFLHFASQCMPQDSLAADFPTCQILKNLKDLELGELHTTRDWNIVASFLQHTPNLRKLALKFNQWSKRNIDSEEDLQGDVMFQRDYLETVAIKCPRGNDKLASELVQTLKTLTIEIIIFL